MNARLCATFFMLWVGAAGAQGFADLGGASDGFALPDPERTLTFPADHGPHPGFRIEWWYLTATLSAEDGTRYGAQWTLFRSALVPEDAPGWSSPVLWLGHAAVTTPDRHFVDERMARGGIGTAGVTADPFDAWIDEWRLAGPSIGDLKMSAQGTDFAYELSLSATGPLVLQGERGYSIKSPDGQASHYYSQPFYDVTGTLTLPEGDVSVTGRGWLDREWSSQPLSADQDGWDWFSLSFDDGARLMGFRVRGQAGEAFTSATWIAADGTPTPYGNGALVAEPLDLHSVAGHEVPVRWHLTLADRGLDVTLAALNPDAWMATSVPYWEGPVAVAGSHSGRGYLEMTGYD